MRDLYAPASSLPPIDRVQLWQVVACAAVGWAVFTLVCVVVS